MTADPLHKSVRLACGPARAFELFTREISIWWPPSRRHTDDPDSQIFLLSTGRFFERSTLGREVELGRVRVWDPPARLELDFYPGTDAEHPTAVTITFTATGVETEVTVEHSPTPASADLWPARVARYHASWALVLAALVQAAETP